MPRWIDAVRIVRADALRAAKTGPGGTGRATVFDFAGDGTGKTWLGSVTLPPGMATGPHHHGSTEVAFYLVRGRVEVRWGKQLDYVADLEPGDFAHFAPNVPHQERNLSEEETAELVAVRSDPDAVFVKLDTPVVEAPERRA